MDRYNYERMIKHRTKIAEMFINKLEENYDTWKKPFKSVRAFPSNAVTKKEYSGINKFALMMEMISRGNIGSRFATFNQIRDEKYHPNQKWHLKKGAKSFMIEHVHWYIYENRRVDEDDVNRAILKGVTEEEADLYLRKNSDKKLIKKAYISYTNVFNEDDIEGIAPLPETQIEKMVFNDKFVLDVAKAIDVPIITHTKPEAYYNPQTDTITLPNLNMFNSQYDYDATAFHELTHATGHKTRLDRDILNSFGSEKYAYEELIAEIGSAMAMSQYHFEINGKHFNNHAAYVKGWIKAIKNNNNYLVDAIREAVKANDYILKNYELYLKKQKQFRASKYHSLDDIPNLDTYNEKQIHQFEWGINSGIDITPILNNKLTDEQMYWINEGFIKGIDAALYADPAYSTDQMVILRTALIKHIDISDILNHNLAPETMKKIITAKEEGTPYDHLLKQDKQLDYLNRKKGYERYNISLNDIKNSVMITDYAVHLGFNLIKERNGLRYTLKEHDSLKIWANQNHFVQFSKSTSSGKLFGGSIIDFIKEFDPKAEDNLNKAIKLAKDYMIAYNLKPNDELKNHVKEEDLFLKATSKTMYIDLLRASIYGIRNPKLPPRSELNQMRNVYGYLMKTRGIHKDILNAWVERNKMYQDDHRNIVWVERDFDNKPKNVHVKGTIPDKQYRKDLEDSNKVLGFTWKNEHPRTLFITESIIDMMSIQSMGKYRDDRLNNYDYLSLQGTYTEPLKHYLLTTDTSNLQNIYICTDNDAPGENCAKAIEKMIKELQADDKYKLNTLEIGRLMPLHKDFNEDLVYNLEHPEIQNDLPQLDGAMQENSKELTAEEEYGVDLF